MATILSGLVTVFDHDLTSIFGIAYQVNGWNPMHRYDGFTTAAQPAGIGAPPNWSTTIRSAAPTAGAQSGFLDVGTHLVRYRYGDSRTLYVSDPSKSYIIKGKRAGITARTGSIYSLSNLAKSGDPKVDRIIIEMTDAGGDTFYEATVLANSSHPSVALQTGDQDLRGRPLYYDEFGHDPPPFFSLIEGFRGRLWGVGHSIYSEGQARVVGATAAVSGSGTTWTSAARGRYLLLSGDTKRYVESVLGATQLRLESAAPSASLRNYQLLPEVPDVLYFSRALNPESWPPENRTRVLEGRPEKARALKGWRRDLMIFGERSMDRLVFQEDPFRDGVLERVEGERGTASRRCVQNIHDAIYALDYKGVYRWQGGSPQHLSERLDPFFDPGDLSKGYVDLQYRSTFHSVHYPERHQILWFVVLNGVPGDSTAYTLPHHAIVYDYMNDSFSIMKFDVAMVASTVAPGSNGASQTVLADESGRLWVLGISTRDGAHPTKQAASFLVKSGSTSNAILASGSALYASGDGLAGVPVYWNEGTQVGVVSSNSAGGLAVSGGFSTAPSSGDTILVGRTPAKWKSKAFYLDEPKQRRSEGRYLHIFFEPQSSGTIRVRFYVDRSSTAYTYSEDFSSGGVALDADNNYYTVDLSVTSGYAKVPLPSDGSYTLEFEIESVTPGTTFEMSGFELDGYVREEDVEL